MVKTILKRVAVVGAFVMLLAASKCDDAVVASKNVSKAADNFEVLRRVVFVNGYTNDYILEVIGLCSIEDQSTLR